MNQVNLNLKKGEITLEDIPLPQLRENGILIKTAYSLISSGTK